MVIIYSVN